LREKKIVNKDIHSIKGVRTIENYFNVKLDVIEEGEKHFETSEL
jgi:hypothetical protein